MPRIPACKLEITFLFLVKFDGNCCAKFVFPLLKYKSHFFAWPLCLLNGFSNTFALPLAGKFETIKMKQRKKALEIPYFTPEKYSLIWLRGSHKNDQFMKFPKKPLLMRACASVSFMFGRKKKKSQNWPNLTLNLEKRCWSFTFETIFQQ